MENCDPHVVFIEVLSHPHAGARQHALTGDMISAYSEMNQLLGRTKGRLPPPSWAELADELVRCTDLFTSAWSAYLQHVDDDPELRLQRGRDATRAFQAAVVGLRTALDTLRRDAGLIDIVSWPHHDG